MTFTDKLKELVGKAHRTPWGYDDKILVEPLAALTHTEPMGFLTIPDAALICHLVNHAEDIVALVEAAQAQLDYMDMCNDKGDLERNLRAALSRLEAKP